MIFVHDIMVKKVEDFRQVFFQLSDIIEFGLNSNRIIYNVWFKSWRVDLVVHNFATTKSGDSFSLLYILVIEAQGSDVQLNFWILDGLSTNLPLFYGLLILD